MAATKISDIATWASTTMLKRADLQTEAVELAKGVYQIICDKVPFEALQKKSPELELTAGTDSYNLATILPALTPALPVPAGIMSIRYTKAAGQMWRLRRSNTRTYDAITFSSALDPRTYARFGTSIELMPAPNSSTATIRVRYWSSPTIAATVADTELVTPLSWDELFKWETLYRLYFIVGQAEKAAQLIIPMPIPRQPQPKRTQMFEVGIIPRLWNDLLLTISQRENVDEDFSVNPIVRPYTNA